MDKSTSNDPRDKDGTKADSGGTRTHLVWDHRQHELHFLHPSREEEEEGLPILHLYKGTSKFQAFCSGISSLYDGAVHYAFSSAYSVAPMNAVAADSEGEDMVTVTDHDSRDKWFSPDLCAQCSPPAT